MKVLPNHILCTCKLCEPEHKNKCVGFVLDKDREVSAFTFIVCALRKLDSVVTSLCILQEWAVPKKASDGQLAGHEYTE